MRHETIYQALYHGGKSGLSRQLTRRLRTGRPQRKRRRRPNQRQVRFVAPTLFIDLRPPAVADRGRIRMGTNLRARSTGRSTAGPVRWTDLAPPTSPCCWQYHAAYDTQTLSRARLLFDTRGRVRDGTAEQL